MQNSNELVLSCQKALNDLLEQVNRHSACDHKLVSIIYKGLDTVIRVERQDRIDKIVHTIDLLEISISNEAPFIPEIRVDHRIAHLYQRQEFCNLLEKVNRIFAIRAHTIRTLACDIIETLTDNWRYCVSVVYDDFTGTLELFDLYSIIRFSANSMTIRTTNDDLGFKADTIEFKEPGYEGVIQKHNKIIELYKIIKEEGEAS